MEKFSQIREMAIVDPLERASTAQMLVKHFGGAGLNTPRNQVPPLSGPSTVTAPGNLVPARRGQLRAHPTRNRPRDLRRGLNTFSFAAQYRIGKPRNPPARPFQLAKG
jgi:hypothetical protein